MSCVLSVLIASVFLVTSAQALIADRHAPEGSGCVLCHAGADPGRSNVSEKICIACHTETPKGKSVHFAGKDIANIHEGHFDTYECLNCHRGHEESVLACLGCHQTADPIRVP